jgi:hypothetical protein
MDKLLLLENGLIRLLPASFYESLDWEELRLWMHFKGVYGLPTTELIDWLNITLGHWKKRTLEIGAGNGFLAHHLGILAFDSKFQARPDIKKLYEIQGQPVINYPDFVQTGECLEVVEKHKPHTVILQWGSQKSFKNDPMDGKSGCCGGIDYENLYRKVKQIILIGADEIHSANIKIMNIPHKEYVFPWIKSRNVNTNKIYVWNNKKWTP